MQLRKTPVYTKPRALKQGLLFCRPPYYSAVAQPEEGKR